MKVLLLADIGSMYKSDLREYCLTDELRDLCVDLVPTTVLPTLVSYFQGRGVSVELKFFANGNPLVLKYKAENDQLPSEEIEFGALHPQDQLLVQKAVCDQRPIYMPVLVRDVLRAHHEDGSTNPQALVDFISQQGQPVLVVSPSHSLHEFLQSHLAPQSFVFLPLCEQGSLELPDAEFPKKLKKGVGYLYIDLDGTTFLATKTAREGRPVLNQYLLELIRQLNSADSLRGLGIASITSRLQANDYPLNHSDNYPQYSQQLYNFIQHSCGKMIKQALLEWFSAWGAERMSQGYELIYTNAKLKLRCIHRMFFKMQARSQKLPRHLILVDDNYTELYGADPEKYILLLRDLGVQVHRVFVYGENDLVLHWRCFVDNYMASMCVYADQIREFGFFPHPSVGRRLPVIMESEVAPGPKLL